MRMSRMFAAAAVAVGVIAAWNVWSKAGDSTPKSMFPKDGPKIPLGLVPIVWPEDNPYSAEKAELGWLLFFDKRLSSDGSVSCASCHSPEHGFTDGSAVSTGIAKQKGGRSAPSVINRVYGFAQFWDGRVYSLEDQAKGPIANPIEMTSDKDAGKAHAACIERLRQVKGYRARFKQVFGTEEFTIDHIAKAIATFERTILSGNSAYDRFKAGDKTALNEAQQRGMKTFFSNHARCDSCHDGAAFTTNQFANIGIGMDKPDPDLGRFMVTKNEADKGAFKTPGLRDIARTAPYMHDGSLKTLEEVVEHYDKGGVKNQWLHQDIKPLKLSVQDKKDLVEFLHGLNGEGWQHIKAPTSLPK
ncbi:MAG: cytochrome-c peroxidase [Planctomycetes bacterium]|nr:cytochrome-c peroxidase [Planctomycetota bacterium]